MDQKTFLVGIQQKFHLKYPIWLNSQDTFAVSYENLVYASDLTVEHCIGRLRLTLQNSDVQEIWVDVDNHENAPWKEFKEKLLNAHKRLMDLGIPAEFIYPKVTGRGVHFHVFIKGLPDNFDPAHLLMKAQSSDADGCSKVQKHKVREFGAVASTGKGFTSYVSDLSKLKCIPMFEETAYPDVQAFEATKEFLANLSFIEMDKRVSNNEHDVIVDYERDGDYMQLFKCPLITYLATKSKTDHHLLHNERVFIMTEFIHFGDQSRCKIHEIISTCSDYDESFTQLMINHAMQNNYHPCTCKWAHDMGLNCPRDCKGSGGKSPIKFAWSPLSLKELKDFFKKIMLVPKQDDELLDVVLAATLDSKCTEEPVWLFVIGAASTGKTTYLMSCYNKDDIVMIDSLTTKTFISGKTEPDPKTKKDKLVRGLLCQVNGKALYIKEGTTILTKGKEERDEIFGQLRAIYDRYYGAAFGSIDGSLIPEEWKKTRMGLIIACTPFVDNYTTLSVMLGERFLKIRLTELNFQQREETTVHAIDGLGDQDKLIEEMQKKVKRFIHNLEPPTVWKIPDVYKSKIIALAELIVQLRRPVTISETNMGIKLYDYESAIESPTRIAKQLTKLGILLNVIRNNEFNDETYKTVLRVALDTLLVERKQIILQLAKYDKPIGNRELATDLHWEEHRLTHHMKALLFIDLVQEDGAGNYRINPTIKKLMVKACVTTEEGCTESKHTVYKMFSRLSYSPLHHEFQVISWQKPCLTCGDEPLCGDLLDPPFKGCRLYQRWLRGVSGKTFVFNCLSVNAWFQCLGCGLLPYCDLPASHELRVLDNVVGVTEKGKLIDRWVGFNASQC